MKLRKFLHAISAALLMATATAASVPVLNAATQTPTEIEVDVRSSVTGRGLAKAASIKIKDEKGGARASADPRADAPLRQRFQVPPGLQDLEVEASGHSAIRATVDVPQGARLPVKVWMDPAQLPQEMRPEVVRQKLVAGRALLHGHVIDDATGEPLRGATVTLELTKERAQTDENGYFVIYGTPERGVKAPDPELPSSDNLVVQHAGFKTNRIVGTALMGGHDTHFIIEMEPGTGTTERDDTHKLVRQAQEAAGKAR